MGVDITVADLRAMKKRMNRTRIVENKDIAERLGVSIRCVENWFTDEGKINHRKMSEEHYLAFNRWHREVVYG